MRINVYAEEITNDTEVITKIVDNRRFYGIRLYLESSPKLHHSATDDDRTAITFWVPWRDGKNHHDELITTLSNLVNSAWEARRQDAA